MLYKNKTKDNNINKDLKSREFCDLVYDIESYIIDVTCSVNYCNEHISLEYSERKNKAAVRDTILSERERNRVLTALSAVLMDMGVPRQLKGFRILEDCVLEASREAVNNRQYYLMNIFPVLADKYHIKPNNTEKLCRYACDYIEITPFISAKYPELGLLIRKNHDNVTLKDVVDALVNYIIKSCKLKTKRK